MQIQRLTQANAALLRTVAEGVFDYPIDDRSLANFLDCPRHVLYVAVADGEVVGMISGVEYFHPDKPTQLWINELGVAPDFRNQGLGRKLVTRLLEHAKEQGCVCAWVGTEKDDVAANRCYAAVSDGEPPADFVMFEWDFSGPSNEQGPSIDE